MFRIGSMSVIPSPQFALRMKLSRQRSESLMWQLSSSSVVSLRSRIAESSSQMSWRWSPRKLTRGTTTRQPVCRGLDRLVDPLDVRAVKFVGCDDQRGPTLARLL